MTKILFEDRRLLFLSLFTKCFKIHWHREMQIKTTVRYYSTPTRMAKIKKATVQVLMRRCKKLGSGWIHWWWHRNGVAASENSSTAQKS